MKEAFGLEEDDRAAVFSHDKKNAYVLRLDRRELSLNAMREKFLAEANNWYGGQMMKNGRLNNARNRLRMRLLQRAGLDLQKFEEYQQQSERGGN